MTDAPITLELLGPGPEYKKVSVWLPQLFMETSRTGVCWRTDTEAAAFQNNVSSVVACKRHD